MGNQNMNVIISSDHGAVDLKKRLTQHLKKNGWKVNDKGVFTEDSVDYPDIVQIACAEFLQGDYQFGVVLCGTGIGASIAANKMKGIRCALVHDDFTAEMAGAHNNANFIAMGGRVSYSIPEEQILDTFIHAEFQGGRHQRRITKVHQLENIR